jgi:hypothetical protein
MKLPNADKLVIEREKIVDYLLNPTHRFGGSKARFFDRFGFDRSIGSSCPKRYGFMARRTR